MPKNSKRLRSDDEVRDGDITYLPLPILEPDLLFGLGQRRPRSLDWAMFTPV